MKSLFIICIEPDVEIRLQKSFKFLPQWVKRFIVRWTLWLSFVSEKLMSKMHLRFAGKGKAISSNLSSYSGNEARCFHGKFLNAKSKNCFQTDSIVSTWQRYINTFFFYLWELQSLLRVYFNLFSNWICELNPLIFRLSTSHPLTYVRYRDLFLRYLINSPKWVQHLAMAASSQSWCKSNERTSITSYPVDKKNYVNGDYENFWTYDIYMICLWRWIIINIYRKKRKSVCTWQMSLIRCVDIH